MMVHQGLLYEATIKPGASFQKVDFEDLESHCSVVVKSVGSTVNFLG